MFCKLILSCLISLFATVQAQRADDSKWTYALKDNLVVVVVQIEEKVSVVNYEKARVALRPFKEGDKVMLPLLGRPDIGYLFRVKMIETIKPNNSQSNPKFSPGAVIGIFVCLR